LTTGAIRGRSDRWASARWIAIVVLGGVAAVLTMAAFAPASFVDYALSRASLGRARLADAEGSVWHGAGRLVLLDSASDVDVRLAAGMTLPGRIRWQLQALPLVVGLAEASVSVDGMPQAVRISADLSELRVGAGSLELPAMDLSGLGSPWNTIRPVAAVALRWDSLTLRSGVLDGKLSVELRDTASAMTQVRPLGSYRIDVVGSGRELALSLVTLTGALQLQGNGRWDLRGGVSFTAQAWADGPQRAQLQSLLGLIGRREADRTVIRIGG